MPPTASSAFVSRNNTNIHDSGGSGQDGLITSWHVNNNLHDGLGPGHDYNTLRNGSTSTPIWSC